MNNNNNNEFPTFTLHSNSYQTERKRHKVSLNELLDANDIVILKNNNDPKMIYTMSNQRSKSTKSISRPYTMTGERVKHILKQEQQKRPSTEIQDVRRRIQSANKSRENNKYNTTTRQVKNQKQKLKEYIDNYEVGTTTPLELIFQFFDCLSKTENFYQGIFKYINQTLKKQIVFNKNEFDIDGIKLLIDQYKNQELVRAIYSQQKIKVTYKEVTKILSDQIVKITKSFEAERQTYETYTKQLENTIEDKRKTILKMKQTIKYYHQHPSKHLFAVVQKLEEEINNLKAELGILQNMNQELLNNYELLNKTNMVLAQRIEDLKNKVWKLEMEKLMKPEVPENQELIDFEKHVGSLKHMLDKSIVRMVGMKEEFNKIQSHNQNLINQRSELARRAAVGFSQLTPRPNIKIIFEDEGLNFEKIFKIEQRKQKKLNTQQFVRLLVGRFKETFNTFKELEATKKIVYDNKGNPLNKFKQKKAQKVLGEVIQTKQLLFETQRTGEALRQQYNRLLQQKNKKPIEQYNRLLQQKNRKSRTIEFQEL